MSRDGHGGQGDVLLSGVDLFLLTFAFANESEWLRIAMDDALRITSTNCYSTSDPAQLLEYYEMMMKMMILSQ